MFRLDFSPPFITRNRLNLALLLFGFAAIAIYVTCTDSCAGISGSLFGIDLIYVGLGFLAAISGALLLRWQSLAFWMLAAGVGSELYLISYMVRSADYCPFCLLFAAVILSLAAVNFNRARLRALLLGAPAGFILLLLSFAAAPLISYGTGQQIARPSFGQGPVEIRLYTDYFCGPCSRIEPELEQKLVFLVETGKARVVFVDVPLHPLSPLYAGYFLAMLEADGDIRHAIEDRTLLFAAAKQKLATSENLKEFLNQAGRKVSLVDEKPDFSFYNQLLTEDRVTSTPTLVIRRQDQSETFKGTSKVLEGIQQLIEAG